MTAITYLASRGIVPEGLSVTALDISILASDDSFNSVAGDFAGMVAGDWVLVSGSAVDDGWHELSVDSTANKITTNSTLTDETAGSSITIVGYKHGLGQQYTLDFDSQSANQSLDIKNKTGESLSGVIETLLLNTITYWDINTSFITAAELPYWLEFFNSVAAGEVFTIDIYGSVAVPVNPLNAILEGNPKTSRVSTQLLYTNKFKVRLT